MANSVHHPDADLPGAHGQPPGKGQIPTAEFRRVQGSDDFRELRRVFRGFAFPMTVAFIVWYALYVGLSVFAPGFMSIKVFGEVTLGLILGLLQFVTTFLITWLYIRHMNKKVDPIAARLREDLEGSAL
ncbi:DUF485 domain-containing protein [Tessaracoccus oleiagri]|uniref:Uncharacterized membrane protein, DUF485 family n=1 Tax=Tessaracoccus oleiagri TaxID=686624 RepID=A0A1G9JKK3_9ACTN|nr:DUF485 domain-containing protein [Tessaracoccus oleiagri]SDL38049.1 Uncharacterized membrane protein, DUF485 family [Tessaracoccus oleiagri]